MVARDCHDYYGSSATPRRQQRTVRLPQTPRVRRAPPGRFPRSPSTGRQDRRSAVPRGHRRALPQHRTRPRPTEQQTIDQDGPRTETGARAPQTAHSRQFRGCSWVSGLLTLIRLLRLSASLARTARWRQTVVPSSGAAPALRHTSGIRLPLNFSRPLRRPRAGPFTPPGHMAPRGAVLASRTSGSLDDVRRRERDSRFRRNPATSSDQRQAHGAERGAARRSQRSWSLDASGAAVQGPVYLGSCPPRLASSLRRSRRAP